MATRKTGAKGGRGELPAQQGGKKNLFLRGEGRPLSPAASSALNYGREVGGEDGGRPVNSPHGSEEMVPTKTGAKDRGSRTPRAAARYEEPLPEGGGPPAEPGGRIGAKL